MNSKLAYRPEIDGLRTVAVVAVIMFHLNHEWLLGGFLGVDVFFVISGFLITSIIHSQLTENSFSLFDFWKRRVKRLFPALLTVVCTVLLASTFILVAPKRGQLPWQAAAAICSFENIWLWQTTTGYWSTSSDNISLLHTWSLSLEEQFYICLPILLLLIHRLARGKEKLVLICLLAASACWCILGTPHHRAATFYLLPTRAWELLIGSLWAVYAPKNGKLQSSRYGWLFQFVGMISIVSAFMLVANDDNFPSYFPVFPCVGTLLILIYGSSPGPIKSVLSASPVVYVGRISYSLYLWHWPVIVLLKYVNPSFSPLLAISVTFGLACLSYHFVECPFRRGVKRPRLAIALAAIAVPVCFVPILALPSSPFLSTVASESDQLEKNSWMTPSQNSPPPVVSGLGNINSRISLSRGKRFEATHQIRRGKAGLMVTRRGRKPDICVIGSSHARVICSPLAQFSKEEQLSFLSMAASGVGITTTASVKELPDAGQINSARLQHVREIRPRVVVVAGMWSAENRNDTTFKKDLTSALKTLASSAEHVIVLGQVPYVTHPPNYENALRKFLVAQVLSGTPISLPSAEQVPRCNQIVEQTINALSRDNIVFLDPFPLFCAADGTVSVVQQDQFLYSNSYHINDMGAALIFERLLREPISKILERSQEQ